MKKRLLASLFGMFMLSGILTPVLAENYTYKLYDPQTNKSYSAEMITVNVGGNYYKFGFMAGDIACILSDSMNINKEGLKGGNCIGIESHKRHVYNWRECNVNTFLNEAVEVRATRLKEGLRLVGDNQQPTNTRPQAQRPASYAPAAVRSGLWDLTN